MLRRLLTEWCVDFTEPPTPPLTYMTFVCTIVCVLAPPIPSPSLPLLHFCRNKSHTSRPCSAVCTTSPAAASDWTAPTQSPPTSAGTGGATVTSSETHSSDTKSKVGADCTRQYLCAYVHGAIWHNTVDSEFLVPIAHCTLQSLT